MKQQPTSPVGQWLMEKLEEERLSLRAAASWTGLSHTTIAEIIKGASPSPETLKALARAFAGDGRERLALEDKLLVLAGYRTDPPGGETISQPVARLMDIVSDFSESQLKLVTSFANYLAELSRGAKQG